MAAIGNSAFKDCKSLTSFDIPEGVTDIKYSVFEGCTSITSITIPESVSIIESNAFYGCTSLTSIVIPHNLNVIDYGAFYGCSSLTSVSIPKSVTSIRDKAFGNCEDLTDVYCGAIEVSDGSSFSKGLFTDVGAFYESYPQYMTLHVPASSIEAYRATEPWCYFKEIVPLTDEEIDPTSIKSVVKKKAENDDIFNLLGVRVKQPKKGVNIINGKKVIIK